MNHITTKLSGRIVPATDLARNGEVPDAASRARPAPGPPAGDGER